MTHRRERCQERPSRGRHNSLWYWTSDRSVWRVMAQWLVLSIAKLSPSFRFKNALCRLVGARVGKRASIGLGATLDVLFPDLVTIGEDAIVGYQTTILCHEYTREWYRTGPVAIEANATVGANCTILPGVVIGERAIVSAMSLVTRDVPAGETWGGVPARPIKRSSD